MDSTKEIETRIQELRDRRAGLARIRSERIAVAQRLVDEANAEFDEAAILLGREINRLEELLPEPSPEPEPRSRARRGTYKPKITVEDGYTPEEVEHFHRLLRNKTKRK